MSKPSRFIFALVSFFVAAQAGAQVHSLPSGWSMVGNDTGGAIDTVSIFGNTTVGPSVTTVWAWNNTLGTWNFYTPSMSSPALSAYAQSKGYGVLSTINAGEGFWVNAKTAVPVTLSSATTRIAQAKTLLTSLRSNANLLANTGKTGLLDVQHSAVQADLNSLSGAFSGFGDMRRALKHGVQIIQSGVTGSASYQLVNGIYPCGSLTAGSAACQWFSSNATDWATHQLTITNTGGNNYSWSESLIATGAWATSQPPTPSYLGMTLLTSTGPVLGTSITGNSYYADQTGTATVVGTLATGSVTSLSFSGNIQPPYAPTATHAYTAIALSGTEATGTNNTFNLSGSISEVNSSSVSLATLAINSGSNFVDVSATNAPYSMHFVTQAKTTNYQFDGAIDMLAFAQDMNTMCTSWDMYGNCLTTVLHPNWYPGTVSFTGSVTDITPGNTVGKFMTGTLTATLDRTKFNPALLKSSTNFPTESATFIGSVTNNTVAPAMIYSVNSTVATGSTSTSYNITNTSLTYTDPSNNTVTVTGVSNGVNPATVTASMGGITVTPGVNGSSGIVTAKVGGTTTQIGTISNSTVYFTDGSTQSLQ